FVRAAPASGREPEAPTDALGSRLPGERVAYFPAWETLPHERISPGSDTSGRRLAVLRRLAHPDPAAPRTGPLSVVVTPIRGLLQPIVGGLGDIAPVSLRAGQEAALDDVLASLVEIGYTRTDLVERRGEMAVRDGIAVEGMEAFAPAIASRMELLLDHVPAGGRVLACDPERIRTRAADLVRTSQEFLAASWVNAAAGGQAPIDLGAAAFRSITEI